MWHYQANDQRLAEASMQALSRRPNGLTACSLAIILGFRHFSYAEDQSDSTGREPWAAFIVCLVHTTTLPGPAHNGLNEKAMQGGGWSFLVSFPFLDCAALLPVRNPHRLELSLHRSVFKQTSCPRAYLPPPR